MSRGRANEANFQGEINGVPGRREQSKYVSNIHSYPVFQQTWSSEEITEVEQHCMDTPFNIGSKGLKSQNRHNTIMHYHKIF